MSPRELAVRYGFLVLFAALVIYFALAAPGFVSPQSAVFVFQSVAITGVLALGVTATLVVGGFDLSIGSVATSSMMAAAYAMVVLDQGVFVAVAACLAIGIIVGLINGFLIAYVEIPAMLATLASSMFMVGMLRFAILRGEFLLLLPKSDPTVAFLAGDLLPGLSVPVVLMAATLVATWFLLRRSTPGRVIYAMGDNFQAARLTGLPVRRTAIVVYVFAGLTALVAGLIMAAANGAVDFRTVTNGTLLFDVILVVVLGGIPLRGGRGGVRNVVVGVALIAILRNGMTLMDFTTQTQDMLKGLVLLTAIVVDNYLNPRDAETDTVGDL